jgi:LDH2 family malate/lactate/ureidoglycolate dehydrogenase
MDANAAETKRVNHLKLVRLVARSFEKLGVAPDDADIAARVLVAADLRGVDTHGVIRFSPRAWYVKWLRDGSMTARPNLRVVAESASTALLDGDRGMGMVIDRLIQALKTTPPSAGQERVYVAGEIEFETAKERAERGIPLMASVLQGLRDVSAQTGVPYDLE